MSSASLNGFTITDEFYPQRDEPVISWWNEHLKVVWKKLLLKGMFSRQRNQGLAAKVTAGAGNLSQLSQTELANKLLHLRGGLRKQGLTDLLLLETFSLIDEVASRSIGMRYFPHQVEGAAAMLQGKIVEMDTGQGKSFCATLAASTAALAGVPTCVITVNEYLAERDAVFFQPLYEALGLRSGVVKADDDAVYKRQTYCKELVYCTNKQIAFDYLFDRMTLNNQFSRVRLQLENLFSKEQRANKLILPGLGFAIVDEADSILVDEAVTPLKISAPKKDLKRTRFYKRALALAAQLKQNTHFVIEPAMHRIYFTREGEGWLAQQGEQLGGFWSVDHTRNELVLQALKARHFFLRDKQYVLVDGEVQIVDEFTGRIMADRRWESGLHQMVEFKEGCEVSGERGTLASISYQRFFRRFVNLSGMTGTAKEICAELRHVYRLEVYRVTPAQKIKRIILPLVLSADKEIKWQRVVARIEELHSNGKAVLIGTRSVEVSQLISERLHERGLSHQLLNALNDAEEAGIVALAGRKNAITVATNMAGRGTDIKLTEEVRQTGGLHVIATEFHEARRVDRQLFGRCARQGDPGVVEIFASMEDEILQNQLPEAVLLVMRGIIKRNNYWARFLGRMIFSHCQKKSEYIQQMRRKLVLKNDRKISRNLAFSGGLE